MERPRRLPGGFRLLSFFLLWLLTQAVPVPLQGQIAPPGGLNVQVDCQGLGGADPQDTLEQWYNALRFEFESQLSASCNSFLIESVPDLAGLQVPADSSTFFTRTVEWRLSDTCGTADTILSSFSLIDTLPPELVCPANDTVSTPNPEACFASVTLPKPPLPITDNCSPNVDTIAFWAEGQETPLTERDSFRVSDPSPVLTLAVGRNRVYYEVKDEAGNRDTCVFLIQVNDASPPTVLCREDSVFTSPVGPGILSTPIDVNDLVTGAFFFFRQLW